MLREIIALIVVLSLIIGGALVVLLAPCDPTAQHCDDK